MKLFFSHLHEVQAKLGYTFRRPELLQLAFVHRSFWNENQDLVPEHNERLEFLGDSVLGLLIADFLYRTFPEIPEGQLSDWRSRLVEAPMCVTYVQQLEIGDFLLLGRGEQSNVGKGRESILADLFESVIGALYLDGGFLASKAFFFRHFKRQVEEMLKNLPHNWKAELQDFAQKTFQQPPRYEVIEEWGPPHQRRFRVVVYILDEKYGEGEGGSKKEAQAEAAADALRKIEP